MGGGQPMSKEQELEQFEDIFCNVHFVDIKKILKYIQEKYISRDEIEKALEICEKVYEREMKPYQTEYGIDVTYLSKKEKTELTNKRNCLITQMETYKQLLGLGGTA